LALHDLNEKDKAIALAKQALLIYQAIESPKVELARDALKQWGGGS